MSEKIRFPAESYEESSRMPREKVHRPSEESPADSLHEHQQNIEQIIQKVESVSASVRERAIISKPVPQERNPRFVGEQSKNNSLRRSLRHIQKGLKPYQRPFSKFLHNGAVEQVNEFSAKTIARPSGLLFGGVVSFLTSLGILFVCRYYGYEYNYFLGLISFPLGFGLGLTIEFISRPLRSR